MGTWVTAPGRGRAHSEGSLAGARSTQSNGWRSIINEVELLYMYWPAEENAALANYTYTAVDRDLLLAAAAAAAR